MRPLRSKVFLELLVLTGLRRATALSDWQLESGPSPSPRGVGSNDPETAAAVLSKEKKGANSKLLTMKSSARDMRSNLLGRTEWRFWHDSESAASVQKTMLGSESLPVAREQSLFGSLASGAKLVS
jgi:hypothetical protein